MLAGWPTLIFEMSDSLKATVIVIEAVLTISMRPELLEEDDELLLEPPRLPAVELEPDPELPLEPEPSSRSSWSRTRIRSRRRPCRRATRWRR